MPTQDSPAMLAEQNLAHAISEDTAAADALTEITLELMSLDREKCVVKEAAVLRLMQQVNPTAQEKNGERAKRSGTSAESVWETDEEAAAWLARYHRKVAQKIAVETRARQAAWRVKRAQVLYERAMLRDDAPSLQVEAITEQLGRISERIEQVGEWFVSGADRIVTAIGRAS